MALASARLADNQGIGLFIGKLQDVQVQACCTRLFVVKAPVKVHERCTVSNHGNAGQVNQIGHDQLKWAAYSIMDNAPWTTNDDTFMMLSSKVDGEQVYKMLCYPVSTTPPRVGRTLGPLLKKSPANVARFFETADATADTATEIALDACQAVADTFMTLADLRRMNQ